MTPFVKTKLYFIFKENVLSVKCYLQSKLSGILSLKKNELSAKWYILSPNNVLLQSFRLTQTVLFVSDVRL